MSADTPDDGDIDRRTYLAALSATAAAGLAGCSGDGGSGGGSGGNGSGGGGSDQQLGERVPSISIASLGGVASASSIEQANLHVRQQMQEVLGLSAEVTVKELTTFWSEAYSDARTFNYHVDLSPPFPSNLDPANIVYPYHIKNAGANGKPNVINYANCEFSQKLDAQRTAANREERQQLVTDALSIASEEIAPTTLCTSSGAAIYRTDQLQANAIGTAGAVARNPEFLWNTKPTGGADGIRANITPANIANAVYLTNRPASPWVGTVYLPPVYRDKNYELAGGVAKDWSVSDSYQTFTFNLREGMTFHNGDALTAEDVKWTFEFLNENAGSFATITEFPYESVNAVDETTVEVNMSQPSPSWLGGFVPIWGGVLPKQVWLDAGADQNPKDPSFDRIVGSGPYQVEEYQARQLLALQPYEDHHLDVGNPITFRGYSDRQSARRAFESGDLNLLMNSTTDTNEQIKQALGDRAKTVTSEGFVSWDLRAQHSFAPSMFREFRHAVSQAISRQRLNSILNSGNGSTEMYSSFLGKTHPWRPESNDPLTKAADSPQANPEAAKQVLRDAGWGWDGQDRLHYPPDKDLTPRWPKDSSPCENPDGFPCLPDLC